MALPDLGVMTLEELCFFTRALFRATGLPLIADADTGFGETLNVMRTVCELEAAGAAAVQIEDQMLPKRCGHLSDKRLVPADEMAAKIEGAVRARTHLRVIARTDAAAERLDAAIARALFREAGADVIFPEALSSADDFGAFARAVAAPLLANMTEFGRTPYLSAKRFEELGYAVVIWPASSLRVAARAIEDLYAHIRDHGGTAGLLDRMQTRAELYEVIGYGDYEALERGLAASVLPDAR